MEGSEKEREVEEDERLARDRGRWKRVRRRGNWKSEKEREVEEGDSLAREKEGLTASLSRRCFAGL